jgi:hypothetical protein
LWRRPRPKLSCGAKERRKKKKILLADFLVSYLWQIRNSQKITDFTTAFSV